MDLNLLLTQLGLKEREAQVYLALLELGESPVQPIARKAGLQRPNCYAVLESLVERGLASYNLNGSRRRYAAEDPQKLTTILEEQSRLLQEALPGLRSLHNRAPGKPKVRYYEGLAGIKQIYEEVLHGDWYDCLFSPDIVLPIWGDYVEDFGKRTAARKIKVREIIASTNAKVPYASSYKLPLQEIRYLPKGTVAETDLILYKNKVALVSYNPDPHALLIEGSGIVQTIQLMFERMWEGIPQR